MTAVPVLAEPGQPPADSAEAGRRVDRLLADAERAVEAYNATAERVERLTAELDRQRDLVAHGQQRVNEMRRGLGAAAAAHYRAGGLDPVLTLMLSGDPDTYLARVAAYDRATSRRTGELHDLLAAQRALEQRREEAAGKLERLTGQQARLQRQKRTAQRKLAAARREYERLSERERAERERASRSAPRHGAARAQPAAEAPPASGRAALAVAAARGVVGRPYAWGQAGPDAFDCSGLVQWAWAQAGVSLPRTSQAQAGAGRRVPLGQARPGDIVVYRADASHVGIYAGNGQVVHSPHPGATVRYDPVGMMPVSAVVRP
ncbi:hypothetical protein D7294_12505 [Streptomyces hoynatensis]|uniref:NlpC/P60 domain-containing protein n=2 Tax=Streptomyces hoynatensis TaxID=1141874 RepID=A0A3A9Z3V9_9ACTN|nr:hypothetical protein D7294_12505 [Streptomyces hoynatensis]